MKGSEVGGGRPGTVGKAGSRTCTQEMMVTLGVEVCLGSCRQSEQVRSGLGICSWQSSTQVAFKAMGLMFKAMKLFKGRRGKMLSRIAYQARRGRTPQGHQLRIN